MPKRLAAAVLIASLTACTSPHAANSGQAQVTTQATNPIITNIFTADPAPIVHDGRVYLYVGHDEAREGEMFRMTDWRVYSTDDMKTWIDYGPIMNPTDFKWAVGDAWASEPIEKDGKFWLYTAVEHDGTDHGKSIGVAVSNSPTGPFIDALGKALVANSDTDGPHTWDDIDPTVFEDTDGTFWLYWGNANLYYAPLKPDMIGFAAPVQKVALTHFEEGPWLFKRGDVYYMAYAGIDEAENKNEQIYYSTAPTVTGPWSYRGKIMGPGENSFTIHPGIVEFKGDWYFFYHNAALSIDGVDGAMGRRSVRAEHLYFNEDGSIRPIIATQGGLTLPRQD